MSELDIESPIILQATQNGLARGDDGESAYVYIAYASDDQGTGFSLTYSVGLYYIAILTINYELTNPTAEDFVNLWINIKGVQGDKGDTGDTGASAYVYIAYATNDQGADFTTIFNPAYNYIAIKKVTQPLQPPVLSDFTGLWKNYKGEKGDIGNSGSNGANAYVYIAYADDSNGTGFTTVYNASKNYIAVKSTNTVITNPQASDFTGIWYNYKGATGANGVNAYLYLAYASDEQGTGFSNTYDANLDYIAIKRTTTAITPQASDFVGLWKNYKGNTGQAGTNGTNGANAYVYIAYASDNAGTGFTTVFNSALNYIAIKSSDVALTPVLADFNGLWFNYKGATGENGTNGSDGSNGTNGANAYIYIGYASDDSGTGFTTTFNASLNYIAVKSSTTALTPVVGDFAGLWFNYKGAKGDTGENGTNGSNGANAYVYIAYASDASGTGFTMTYDAALNYIAIKTTTTAIGSPSASDFTGLWKNYKGDTGATGADATDIGVITVTFKNPVTNEEAVADLYAPFGYTILGASYYGNNTATANVLIGTTNVTFGASADLSVTASVTYTSATANNTVSANNTVKVKLTALNAATVDVTVQLKIQLT